MLVFLLLSDNEMTARMSALIYNGCKSLRTMDNCVKGLLLNNHISNNHKPLKNDVINIQGRSVLATVSNVLSPVQCNEIVDNCKKEPSFSSMLDKYKASQRNNSRMLVLDKEFTINLWKVIESDVRKIFNENFLPFQPLGFDVGRGEWQLFGLNEGCRINRYSATRQEFFSIHKDAQYCPNGDCRSLLTLLIYLNEDFNGGETAFYFPKQNDNSCKGKDMTAEEEIKSLGGLEQGYDSFKIEPSVGKAVIFSHNILHESIPVTTKTKYVLKTDVVVKRCDKSYGFAISEAERSDYLQCLNHFREAQSKELNGLKAEAGELYERALSIRYCYPMVTDAGNSQESSKMTNDYAHGEFLLPNSVWQHIFSFLNGKDIDNVLKAFPGLYRTKNAWETRRCVVDSAKSAKQPLHIPFVDSQLGICTQFRFKDRFFFSENEEACIRVAAMYAFCLLGHRADDHFYTVRYNPETQDVCAVALRSLLTDAFLNRPCFGSVYAVSQQDPLEKDLWKDFSASVDSSYMALRHGAQFLGGPVGKQMKVNVKWHGVSDKAKAKYIEREISEDETDGSDKSDISGDDAEVGEKALTNATEKEEKCDAEGKSKAVGGVDDNEYDINDGGDSESDENIESLEDDDIKKKIMEVTKDNILKGEHSLNEFIHFYDTCDETSASVPVCIKDVIVYNTLDAFFSEFSFSPDWFEEYLHENTTTHHTSLTEELKRDFSTAEDLYLTKMIEISTEKPAVSAAIVTNIAKNTQVLGHMCFCYWPGGDGYDKIHESNRHKCYNHLVFDFSTHDIVVTKYNASEQKNIDGKTDHSTMDKSFHCKDGCIFSRDFFDEFCKKRLNDGLTDVFVYKVDITPILHAANGFNHASCNCSVPSFEFEECHNLQDYPALDHIHIVGGVNLDTNEVIVWTFYGGIVAL